MTGWYARLSYERKEEIAGYLFIMPWIVGFLVFNLGAMVVSFVMSLLKADFLSPATFVGLRNYQNLLEDAVFHHDVQPFR